MRIVFLILTICTATQLFSQDLSNYHWKKRLVVVVSMDVDSRQVKEQLHLFEKVAVELEERDMLALKMQPNNQALTKFRLNENFEGVLLIGKDGGLKGKYELSVQPKVLFELVDSMPMRKAEMRKGDRN